jgi:RsiW-degrading membrane proteinase PrsW (M82 family)
MAAFRKISSLKIEVDISKLNQLVNIFALMEKSLKAASTTLNKINKSFAEVKEQLKISNQLQQNAEIISRTSQVVSILAAAFAIAAVAAKVFTSALAATGIGVFVILIGALIGAFISSSSATNDQTTAMDKLTETIDEQTESMQKLKEEQAEAIQNYGRS